MKGELVGSTQKHINSQDLLLMVNQARSQCGEGRVRNNDFISRVKDELEGEYYETFVKPSGDSGGRPVEVITMSLKQALRVAARESKTVRRSLVDKLEDMQARSAPPAIPTTFAEALQLAADQAKQLELAAPKVEFVNRYVESKGSFLFREVAKHLRAKEPDLKAFLIRHEIMYLLGKTMMPYQRHIDAGRFIVKTGTSTTTNHAFTQDRFTPKGFEWVSDLWRKENNEGNA